MKRIHVLYSGNVHGVGFRFTAERVAARLDITGFVRNLPDGTVEAVCEGEETQLKTFLDNMQETMAGYIGDSNVDWEPACGEFSSFGIKF